MSNDYIIEVKPGCLRLICVSEKAMEMDKQIRLDTGNCSAGKWIECEPWVLKKVKDTFDKLDVIYEIKNV